MIKILNIIKRIVVCTFILYGYNLIAVNFNMVIPINFVTVITITLFGAPGFFALILFKYIIM